MSESPTDGIPEGAAAIDPLLRLGDERFRVLCEQAPIGMFLTDAEGRTVYHNPRWLSLAGMTAEQARGEGWVRAIHPEDRDALLADWKRVTAAGGDWKREHRILTPQGEVRWVEALAGPLRGAGGELLGYVGTVKNITDRKEGEEERRRLERKLQEAQKLESLGVLAGGVAHDFNNLLTGVIGYVSLALQQPPDDATLRVYLERAVESAQRAAELCRQMLAYSGRGRFVVGLVDLSRAVRDLGALLQTSVSRKAVLSLELADDLPPVLADASQIRQLLLNLALNASEALDGREGAVTVRTGRAYCDRDYLRHTTIDDDFPEGEYLFMEVADTGCGMDEEMRRRVFEPFFTTKFTGRGLGLAAVLGIVRGHHGAIHLTSEPGLGTTVRVLFPPADEAKAEKGAAPAPTEAAAATGGGVLFVDDEPALRDLAERALRLAGFRVFTAADGREALEVFRDRAADVRVVVLDLTMPHLNGEEVLRELRRLHPGVRVILSSGFSEKQATQRISADLLTGFLQKPYRPQELVEKVRGAAL